MATRQEIFTALNLAVNTTRLGDLMFDIENQLQGVDSIRQDPLEVAVDDSEMSTGEMRPATFDEINTLSKRVILMTKSMSNKMNTITLAIDPAFFYSGIDYLNKDKENV